MRPVDAVPTGTCLWCCEKLHEHCALAGLSVAKIERVDNNMVIFGGADVVDGTPVLDIKPYIPYVDGGVGASAPDWVGRASL